MKFIAYPLCYGSEREQLRQVEPVRFEASTSVLAHATAINLYRMLRQPVRFVTVEEYKPWEDAELLRSGFVQPIAKARGEKR